MHRRTRPDDDFPGGFFTVWFWVVALLAAVWIGALVWLIISVIGWVGRH